MTAGYCKSSQRIKSSQLKIDRVSLLLVSFLFSLGEGIISCLFRMVFVIIEHYIELHVSFHLTLSKQNVSCYKSSTICVSSSTR